MKTSSLNRVGPPWSVQVELVEGCNRLCSFCGLRSIRKAPNENLRFMSFDVAVAAAVGLRALAPHARYEFAMHGEPLLHPKAIDMIRLFRRALPLAQFQLTTNGRLLLGKMQQGLVDLFRAGVDIVLLDTYRPERDALRAEASSVVGIRVEDFYARRGGDALSPWSNYRRKVQRAVVLMDDLGERDGEVSSRVVMNHAGNSKLKPVPSTSLARSCTLPFRELSICWNGDVNICCMDWRHDYVCGNLFRQSPDAVWWGALFERARRHLCQKDRSFCVPCSRCDAPSGARVGLLPKYPAPEKGVI